MNGGGRLGRLAFCRRQKVANGVEIGEGEQPFRARRMSLSLLYVFSEYLMVFITSSLRIFLFSNFCLACSVNTISINSSMGLRL